MDIQETIFGTVGGLGLFLFGMGMLSDGLKAAAGNNLRRLLGALTKWPPVAMLVGAGVTCLIQSSSATSVMVVGLVHAGMLTLKQAICVVLGANIGTTFTAWLVAGMSVLKVTKYALPAVAMGFVLHVFGRRSRTRHWGQILLGFGILFIGIDFMKGAFSGLEDSKQIRDFLIWVGEMPILAVLAGTVITMLVQSSSASIAMVQMLAFTGGFGTDYAVVLRVTIPFVLGTNIGTTITAQLAALRTNLAGRRTAMAHTLFNVLGVVIVLPSVYLGWYDAFVRWISPWPLNPKTIMVHMALAHTVFNVSAALVILPAVGLLEKLVLKILPARRGEEEDIKPVTLERHLLDTPPLAMTQAHKEIVRMAKAARKAVKGALVAIRDEDRSRERKVREKEDAVDEFQTEITRYLVALSQRRLSREMANQLPVLLHSVNDLERIADHAVNLIGTASRKMDHRHTFSEVAQNDLRRMMAEVRRMFKQVMAALQHFDAEAARRALEHEDTLNQMQVDFRDSHIQRLSNGTCTAMAGLIFVDFVDNLEKIGDHLANIAEAIMGGLQWRRIEDSGSQFHQHTVPLPLPESAESPPDAEAPPPADVQPEAGQDTSPTAETP